MFKRFVIHLETSCNEGQRLWDNWDKIEKRNLIHPKIIKSGQDLIRILLSINFNLFAINIFNKHH